MFNAVPERYDLVNRVITLGLDGRWRAAAAEACLRGAPRRLLDLCCGTGDLALAVAALAPPGLAIVGLDYSRPMLDRAVRKVARAGRAVTFVRGSVGRLPFADGDFDCVGIAFAFRNLVYRNPLAGAHLAEIVRVLRPGGRFVIVESSQPDSAAVRGLFRLFLRGFVRPVGGALSGAPTAYGYLAESAARFHAPPAVRDLLLTAGFREVAHRPLLLGAAGLYEAAR